MQCSADDMDWNDVNAQGNACCIQWHPPQHLCVIKHMDLPSWALLSPPYLHSCLQKSKQNTTASFYNHSLSSTDPYQVSLSPDTIDGHGDLQNKKTFLWPLFWWVCLSTGRFMTNASFMLNETTNGTLSTCFAIDQVPRYSKKQH